MHPPVPWITRDSEFPSPESADERGFVCAGGELTVDRLLRAYRSGLFPWSVRPVTWWSPDPRGVFEFDRIHIGRSLARALRQKPYEVTFDRAFTAVVRACASVPRKGDDTWIRAEFIDAYESMHRAGWAHSCECWQGDRLVGGVYGVAIGGFFAGESMFHHADDASKIALISLLKHVQRQGFRLFDTQMLTSTTRALGALEISRQEYLRRLPEAVNQPCQFNAPNPPPTPIGTSPSV